MKLQEALDEEAIFEEQILTLMHRFADRFTERMVEINNLMVLQDHPIIDYGKYALGCMTGADMKKCVYLKSVRDELLRMFGRITEWEALVKQFSHRNVKVATELMIERISGEGGLSSEFVGLLNDLGLEVLWGRVIEKSVVGKIYKSMVEEGLTVGNGYACATNSDIKKPIWTFTRCAIVDPYFSSSFNGDSITITTRSSIKSICDFNIMDVDVTKDDVVDIMNGRFNFRRTSLTGFPAQSIRSSNAIALDSSYLLVLIIETSQSRQRVDTSLIHLESGKSPTAKLFDVDSGRVSIHH
nr:hypothetical protein [Tanacetum cinerariifolium]